MKGLNQEVVPGPITDERMSELNLEPLLLHLLVISSYCGSDWERAAENRNLVYEDILDKIFIRNQKKQHFRSIGLSRNEFFQLMECLGLAAWRGNGRTGGDDDFRKVRKLHLNAEKKFKDLRAGELRSVALNIHTRSGDPSGSEGFEFIHKSFGEYLAGRGLLSHGRKLAQQMRDDEAEDVEQAWTELIGPAVMSREILRFLFDEAAHLPILDEAREAKTAMSELLSWILAQGASAHLAFPGLSWRECESRQRNTEVATLALAAAFATRLPTGEPSLEGGSDWTVNIKWPGTPGAVFSEVFQALERMGVTSETAAQAACRRINLSKTNLWGVNLSRADLQEANLAYASLVMARLFGTNLQSANLVGTLLMSTSLHGAHVRGADLRLARLHEADLKEADFRGADLTDADLMEADLTEAQFDDASLVRADLRGVRASDVSMVRANLRGARLSVGYQGEPGRLKRANLQCAILAEADFAGADLSGADLTASDMRGANLTRANLSGANLERADLRGAILDNVILIDAALFGADLSGVSLQYVDLDGVDMSGVIIDSDSESLNYLQDSGESIFDE